MRGLGLSPDGDRPSLQQGKECELASVRSQDVLGRHDQLSILERWFWNCQRGGGRRQKAVWTAAAQIQGKDDQAWTRAGVQRDLMGRRPRQYSAGAGGGGGEIGFGT